MLQVNKIAHYINLYKEKSLFLNLGHISPFCGETDTKWVLFWCTLLLDSLNTSDLPLVWHLLNSQLASTITELFPAHVQALMGLKSHTEYATPSQPCSKTHALQSELCQLSKKIKIRIIYFWTYCNSFGHNELYSCLINIQKRASPWVIWLFSLEMECPINNEARRQMMFIFWYINYPVAT